MTCQSLLLIRGLNELCLPSSTLKSDFPAPQAFTVDLAACKAHCAALLLRLFSSKEGWRQTIFSKNHGLKKKSALFHSHFSFCNKNSIPYVRTLVCSSSVLNQKTEKVCFFFPANDLCEMKRHTPKYQPLYLCRQGYERALEQQAVLKYHIQRLRSWYAEKWIQQKHFLLNNKRFVCRCRRLHRLRFVPVHLLLSLPIVSSCVVLLVLLMHSKSMMPFRIYLSLSPGDDPY